MVISNFHKFEEFPRRTTYFHSFVTFEFNHLKDEFSQIKDWELMADTCESKDAKIEPNI